MLQVNAVQLRAVADYAASLRQPGGDPLFITGEIEESTGFVTLGNEPLSSPPPSDAVVQVDTADVNPNRDQLTAAGIAVAAGTVDLLGKYDAVFWSESAVEKFVIPYYASKALWMAGHVISVLSAKWYGQVPGGPGVVDPMAEIPFALAHLPNSDYVTIPWPDQPATGGAVGADLVLLAVDPQSGQINEIPLSHYL